MAGHGSPTLQVDGREIHVAIVASSWHTQVMDGLIAGAQRALTEARCEDVDLIRVPGSMELPVACARLAPSYDAIVALGVVVRGGTPHFDYVCQGATIGMMQVATKTGVPIGYGLLTCDDEQQALDRAGLDGSREDKGYEAAQAAVATAVVLGREDRAAAAATSHMNGAYDGEL